MDYWIGLTTGACLALALAAVFERMRSLSEAKRQAEIAERKRLAQQVEQPHAIVRNRRGDVPGTVRISTARFPKKVRRNF